MVPVSSISCFVPSMQFRSRFWPVDYSFIGPAVRIHVLSAPAKTHNVGEQHLWVVKGSRAEITITHRVGRLIEIKDVQREP